MKQSPRFRLWFVELVWRSARDFECNKILSDENKAVRMLHNSEFSRQSFPSPPSLPSHCLVFPVAFRLDVLDNVLAARSYILTGKKNYCVTLKSIILKKKQKKKYEVHLLIQNDGSPKSCHVLQFPLGILSCDFVTSQGHDINRNQYT